MNILGGVYFKGKYGRSKNLKKAEELCQRSYDLGNPAAGFNLSCLYNEHIPDEARMMKYLEEGARRGNAHCINCLAILATQSGDHEEAKRCFMTVARSGHDKALHNLMVNYREEPGSMVSKDDLDTTLVLIRLLLIQERMKQESMRCVVWILLNKKPNYTNKDD